MTSTGMTTRVDRHGDRAAVRPTADRDGHADDRGRIARSRRRRPTRDLSRRRAGQRRTRHQRDNRRVSDDDRRGEGGAGPRRRSMPSVTVPGSSPVSAPTTPDTRSSWPGRPRRPALMGCWSLRRITTSRRRPGCSLTSPPSPTRSTPPVMLYDIPHRSGVAIATETLVRLAEHPRIVAVKDAKDDVAATSWVTAAPTLRSTAATDAMHAAPARRRRGRLGRHLHTLHRVCRPSR